MNKLAVLLLVVAAVPTALAQEDSGECKDHPLFSRLPNYYLSGCESAEFDTKGFPVGPVVDKDEKRPKHVQLEGAYTFLRYELKDGAKKASGLQIRRNFENAAKKAGGTIEGTYPGWCQATVEEPVAMGNGCIADGVTMKFARGNKEVWAFAEGDGDTYEVHVLERQAMKQDIAASDILESLEKNGFVALYINFETGKATIQPDSLPTIEQVAQMAKSAPSLKLEVGGHTDNVGSPAANKKLSEARAQAVMKALVERGIAASRLTAAGYGQEMPIADNRLEEGRAKNRRVELVKLKK